MASLLRRLVDLEEADNGEKATPKSRRATAGWRCIMEKVLVLICRHREEMAQEARKRMGMVLGLQGTGSPYGLQHHVASPPVVPPLPVFQGHLSKADELEKSRMNGIPLPPRKCQMPPRVPACLCQHPKSSLASSGNPHQREVWCQECHSRWKIATTPLQMKLQSVPTSLTMQVPGTPTTSIATASPKSTPGMGSVRVSSINCNCGLPANRLRVKKEGATKGRHFYKCPQQICEFFAWDQAEVEAIKTNVKKAPEVSPEISKQLEEMEQTKQELLRREDSLRQREDSVLQMQSSLHQGAQQLVGTVVEQAEQRHQEVMESQQAQYQGQLEQMQNQLIWLTALAGESRVEEVMADPAKSQEVMAQALELRQKMLTEANRQGAQTEGQMPP